jgi:putative membrane protein
MSREEFFTEDARGRVRRSVEIVEAQTSAELVVSVRRRAATYRETDYLAGSVVGFAVLLVLLFHPYEVPVPVMPVQVLLGFAFGAFASSGLWPLKRALTRSRTMAEAVTRLARSIFVERGVSRTKARNGLLVVVSLLEKRVEVVLDHGLDAGALGAPFEAVVAEMRHAIESDAGIVAFADALIKLGTPLGAVAVRTADDVNELPDDPEHA